jgi:hypothetical protein
MARFALLLVIAVFVAGCGSSGGDDKRLDLTTPKDMTTPEPETTPAPSPPVKVGKGVTRREAAVIRGWSDTLRRGHVRRAARYFALPAVVVNGTPPLPIRTRAQAEQFNRLLVCGAKVVALERTNGHRVLATFRLTERPGGACGSGTGHLAHTAFLIRDGRIVQWLRTDDAGGGAPATPS